MGRVDPDKFLTELNKLFERNKEKGSVYLTMKRSEFWEERDMMKYIEENREEEGIGHHGTMRTDPKEGNIE